jgi:hypothetical protein
MDSFQAELRRSFIQDLRLSPGTVNLLKIKSENTDRFLSTWSSYRNFIFLALVLFAVLVIFSFFHAHNVFNSILQSSLSDQSWVETYKVGTLKLQSDLDKLLLYQRDFLSGEIGRNTSQERVRIHATLDKLLADLNSLKKDKSSLSHELLTDITTFEKRLQLWIRFQEELDQWVKAGDPDTANSLFFEKGQKLRNQLLEPFDSIQSQVLQLSAEKTKIANERLESLKIRTHFFNIAWTILVSFLFLTFFKLNTLLNRFSDYLRRWIFKTSDFDNPPETHSQIANLKKNLFTLKSRLWGLRAEERAPRPGQDKEAA